MLITVNITFKNDKNNLLSRTVYYCCCCRLPVFSNNDQNFKGFSFTLYKCYITILHHNLEFIMVYMSERLNYCYLIMHCGQIWWLYYITTCFTKNIYREENCIIIVPQLANYTVKFSYRNRDSTSKIHEAVYYVTN